jgi:8-oxo-dGTP diphosphatase
MPSELWDLTDRLGNSTGRTHRRGDPIPRGAFHVVASVGVVRADAGLLLTQRAAVKDHPLAWEIPAGSVLAGETSEAGAVRELREETGVRVSATDLDRVGRFAEESALFDLYLARVDGEPAIALDPSEVADYRWVTLSGLDDLVASGAMASPWVPRLRSFRAGLGDRLRWRP